MLVLIDDGEDVKGHVAISFDEESSNRTISTFPDVSG